MTPTTALHDRTPPRAARLLAAKHLPTPLERRAIREKAGFSKAELAMTLGVLPVTVARWESGSSTPQLRHALAYHQVLVELRRLAEAS